MQRTIEIKHVQPKAHVRQLLEELMDRLEHQLKHFPDEAVSAHVVFEENGSHQLYRTSVTCHVPGRTVAAHDEGRDAGATIHEAFAQVRRQLEKYRRMPRVRSRHLGARAGSRGRGLTIWLVGLLAGMMLGASSQAAEPQLNPRTAEALRALESKDAMARKMAWLRLEALRDPAALELVRPYAGHRDAQMRAGCLRALAALEGVRAVPLLLEKLSADRAAEVRLAALLALEPLQRQDPAILPAFIKALRDRSSLVRMAAVDVVSRIDDRRASEAILAHNKIEHRTDVRRVLKVAVERVNQRR